MDERPFTERFKENAIEASHMLNTNHSMLSLMWYIAKEIESLRQEITELKQQLKQ